VYAGGAVNVTVLLARFAVLVGIQIKKEDGFKVAIGLIICKVCVIISIHV
jgi:hypothetical protein